MPVEAEIIVNDISFDEGESESPVLENGGVLQPYYKITNRYERDLHKYMMGINSPGGFQGASVAFVQLASPTLLWIAEWAATTIGGKPDIPNLKVRNPNWELLDEWHYPGMIDVMKNGQTLFYPHAGVYVYAHKNPSADMLDDINYACPPWIDPNAASQTVESDQLDDDMIQDEDMPIAGGGNNVQVNPAQFGAIHEPGGP